MSPALHVVRRLGPALAVLLGLGACAGDETLTHHLANERDTARAYYRYAAGGKPSLLEVHGLDATARSALAAAMPQPPGLPTTTFVAEPAAAAHPDFRVVLVFDAPPTMSGAGACALADGAASPGTDNAPSGLIQAAYCHRTRALTEVRAQNLADGLRTALTGDGAAGVDGGLRASLFRVIAALLPPAQAEGAECLMRRGC